MSLGSYTQPIEDGMRVRHDAQARFTVTTGRRTLEDRLTPVESIGGALTLASFMYNQQTMSGGVSWWDPSTGRSIGRPKAQIRVRPQDVIADGDLCPCARCARAAA